MLKAAISKELCEFLTDMETQLNQANQDAIKRRYITTVVIRITMVILLILAVINGFLIKMLNTGLSDTLGTVDIISEKFTNISQDMSTITSSVKKMDTNMTALQPMSKDLSLVHRNVSELGREMHITVGIISAIDNNVYQIDTTMGYVDYKMQGVSRDMYYIGDDMHQFSKPVNWMNKVLPW